ncbi:MAG: cytochrome c3 family protein [Nitrospinota bacterium]|nr:cytochrome c3 family protein [Nitrospinota bacterium]
MRPEFDCKKYFFIIFALVAGLLAFQMAIPEVSYSAEKEKKIPEPFNMVKTGESAAVVFTHTTHAVDAKIKCTECHPKMFKMKMGKTGEKNPITMAAMEKGEFCGKCHNGKDSFGTKDEKNCVKCHSVK